MSIRRSAPARVVLLVSLVAASWVACASGPDGATGAPVLHVGRELLREPPAWSEVREMLSVPVQSVFDHILQCETRQEQQGLVAGLAQQFAARDGSSSVEPGSSVVRETRDGGLSLGLVSLLLAKGSHSLVSQIERGLKTLRKEDVNTAVRFFLDRMLAANDASQMVDVIEPFCRLSQKGFVQAGVLQDHFEHFIVSTLSVLSSTRSISTIDPLETHELSCFHAIKSLVEVCSPRVSALLMPPPLAFSDANADVMPRLVQMLLSRLTQDSFGKNVQNVAGMVLGSLLTLSPEPSGTISQRLVELLLRNKQGVLATLGAWPLHTGSTGGVDSQETACGNGQTSNFTCPWLPFDLHLSCLTDSGMLSLIRGILTVENTTILSHPLSRPLRRNDVAGTEAGNIVSTRRVSVSEIVIEWVHRFMGASDNIGLCSALRAAAVSLRAEAQEWSARGSVLSTHAMAETERRGEREASFREGRATRSEDDAAGMRDVDLEDVERTHRMVRRAVELAMFGCECRTSGAHELSREVYDAARQLRDAALQSGRASEPRLADETSKHAGVVGGMRATGEGGGGGGGGGGQMDGISDRAFMDMALRIGLDKSGAMMLLLPLVPGMSEGDLRLSRALLATVIQGMETRSAVPLGKRLLRAFIRRGSRSEDTDSDVREHAFWWMDAVVTSLLCERLRIVVAEHVLQAVCPDDTGAAGTVGGDALLALLLSMIDADDGAHRGRNPAPVRAHANRSPRIMRRGAVLWAVLCVCRFELDRRPRSELSTTIAAAMHHIGEGLLSEEGEVRVEAFRCKLAAATKFGSGVQGMLGEVDGGADLDGRVMRQFMEGGLKGMAVGTRKNALVLLDKCMGHLRLGRGLQLRGSVPEGTRARQVHSGGEELSKEVGGRNGGKGTDAEERMLSVVKWLVRSGEVVLLPTSGASVGRKWSLLCVLTASVRGLVARQDVSATEVVTEIAMRRLLGCMWHTYDCVRLSARTLLNQIVVLPGSFPGFETYPKVRELLSIAHSMVMSLRSRESDGGAHLMCVVYGKYVRQMGWHLRPFDSSEPAQDGISDAASETEHASREFVRGLAQEIKINTEMAATDWARASRGGFVQGLCVCLQQLIPSTDTRDDGWRAVLEEVVDAAEAAIQVARLHINKMPATHDEDENGADSLSDDAGLGDCEDGSAEPQCADGGSGNVMGDRQAGNAEVSQRAAWLTLKEASRLLAAVAEAGNHLLLRRREVERVGIALLAALNATFHNGLVEQVSLALGKVSERILALDSPELKDIPSQWLQTLLARMTSSEVWRRSCQLGGGVTAIVASERGGQSSVLLQTALDALLDAAAGDCPARDMRAGILDDDDCGDVAAEENDAGESGVERVHGLHMLWHLLKNGRCGDAVVKHGGGRIFDVVLHGLSSPSWRVRNAATLALGAVVERTLGKQTERALRAAELFRAYPTLPSAIAAALPSSDGTRLPDTAESASVITVLAVLGRLRLPLHAQGTQQSDDVTLVSDRIHGFLRHPSMAVRHQAAAASLRFPSKFASSALERAEMLATELASEELKAGQNEVHGKLLVLEGLLQVALRNMAPSGENSLSWEHTGDAICRLVSRSVVSGWALDDMMETPERRSLVPEWHPVNMDTLFRCASLLAFAPDATPVRARLRKLLHPRCVLPWLAGCSNNPRASRPGFVTFLGRVSRIATALLVEDGMDASGNTGVSEVMSALLSCEITEIRLSASSVLCEEALRLDLDPDPEESAVSNQLKRVVLQHLLSESDWDCRRVLFVFVRCVDWVRFVAGDSGDGTHKQLLRSAFERALGVLERSSDVNFHSGCLVACAQLLAGCVSTHTSSDLAIERFMSAVEKASRPSQALALRVAAAESLRRSNLTVMIPEIKPTTDILQVIKKHNPGDSNQDAMGGRKIEAREVQLRGLDIAMTLLQDGAESVRREAMLVVQASLSPCRVGLCRDSLSLSGTAPDHPAHPTHQHTTPQHAPDDRGSRPASPAPCPLLNAEIAIQVVVRYFCLEWPEHAQVKASLQRALRSVESSIATCPQFSRTLPEFLMGQHASSTGGRGNDERKLFEVEASAEDEQDQCLLAAAFADAIQWATKVAQHDSDLARSNALAVLKGAFGASWHSEWCRGWEMLLPSATLGKAEPLALPLM